MPYIEQNNVYKAFTPKWNDRGPSPNNSYSTVVRPTAAPRTPRSAAAGHGHSLFIQQKGSAGSYGANWNVFGDGIITETPWNPIGPKGYTSIPASFPDGLSNTVFFIEMFATCVADGNPGGGTAATSQWFHSNSWLRPIVCTNQAYKENWDGTCDGIGTHNTRVGRTHRLKFQMNPNFLTGCDSARGQSAHSGGVNVGVGDGSVRFVSGSISAGTWIVVTNPTDGQAVPSDF